MKKRNLQCGVSWICLRFFEKHAGGNWGNDDDHFAFAQFFPAVCLPVMRPISSLGNLVL